MIDSITQPSTSGTGNESDIPTGGSFAKTPIGAVLRNTNLSDGAVRLYAELRSYAWGEDGRCFPGQKTLGEDMGWSRSKVYRYTKELKDAELIEIEYRPLHKGKNKPNLYTLNQPSTCGTDVSSLTHPDVSSLTHEVEAVEVEEVFPPYAPPGGRTEEKEKAGSVRGPSGTASFGDKRDPAQNRAGQGRVKERSPRRHRGSRGGTSAEGLEAIRTHKHAHLGYEDLKHYVEVAKFFDFASEDAPPWQVMKGLNNDFQLLGMIRKIVQAAERKAQLVGLPGTEADSTPRKPDPNSVEASFAASKAQEAENTALLKAYMKAYPELCAFDGF